MPTRVTRTRARPSNGWGSDKFGLTRIRRFIYVVPNPDGEIQMADVSKFAANEAPRRYLYLSFKLDPADVKGQLIREAGLHWGTEFVDGTPEGRCTWISRPSHPRKADPHRPLRLDRPRRAHRADVLVRTNIVGDACSHSVATRSLSLQALGAEDFG